MIEVEVIEDPAAAMVALLMRIIRYCLYGEQAPEAVARDESLWHARMNKNFPATRV